MSKTVRLLFNDAMARSIVEGRKTVTRRPIPLGWWRCLDPEDDDDRAQGLTMAPAAPGDLLIGRECWAAIAPDPEGDGVFAVYEYRADHSPPLRKPGGWEDAEPGDPDMVHWRPSIHMPDAAARIRRRVVSVTVERLQDITEDDAVLEGFPGSDNEGEDCPARSAFADAWDAIYMPKRLDWIENPWVWRIEFSAENAAG